MLDQQGTPHVVFDGLELQLLRTRAWIAVLPPQDIFPGAWIGQRNVLQRFDPPCVAVFSQNRKNQRVNRMGACRMGLSGSEATPEMHNRCLAAQDIDINQLILQPGITVNGRVDGRMQSDNVIGSAYIMTEPIHKCGIVVKECAERGHVVIIPGGFESGGHLLRPSDVELFHLAYVRDRGE